MEFIDKINYILSRKKNCTINIINDKLTLSVFSLLEKNLKSVDKINFIIRDIRYIPQSNDIFQEFEMNFNPNDIFFDSYEIAEKNKLQHFAKAKSMYDFIKNHVNIRKNRAGYQIRSNILLIDDDFMVQGSSSLEFNDKALKGKIENINFDTALSAAMDKEQIIRAKKLFERIWYSNTITEDYKSEILKSLGYVYKKHSPEFLYYFTLNELFGNKLDIGVQKFEHDNISFKKTKIWDMLFDFQKDAVLSAIQKINKYNGCIIADSVGLGKTFEALAVIKYFELRQDNVLVLIPAKLYDNWNSFRGAYKDSIIDEVFNFKIMFHTDLSRYKGMSKSGWDLSRFDWSKFDLIVIDESHNFRNRTERDDKRPTRYQRLLQEALVKNQNTKVLLLSATPVNNSLTDLKNQISLITGDKDAAFKEQGIQSVDNLLRRSSAVINSWDKETHKDKKVLLDSLPSDFYNLLDMLTIARSRKHITTCYKNSGIGSFPQKLKPDTYTPSIDTEDKLINFKETNSILEELNLSVYTPMKYIKSECKDYYRRKYESISQSGRVLMSNELRESGTRILHKFNLFKRLESSVFSFSETIRRLIQKIDSCISLIEKNSDIASDDDEDENEEDEDILDYKYEIKVKNLNKEDFLEDLYYDKNILDRLYKDAVAVIKNKRDKKINVLIDILKNKVMNMPYNSENKKVLVFTAFSDTADYIYEKVQGELLNIGIYTGLVSGSHSPKTNNKNVSSEFNSILSAFSPFSRLKKEIPKDSEIQVLVATDCISEGQNLQDCDCVVNYDIEWNPVSLIQRFGRIDRIGSRNEKIKMINFFPDVELNEYLNLEQRVKGKMISVNLASTGDEDILTPEMNDLNFRKRQLEKLRDEVIDIDDTNQNISLTDLNMNDYLYDLSEYIKKVPEIRKVPRGIYSVSEGREKGVIFCFRHKSSAQNPQNDSSLYPYYLIYIKNDGEIYLGNSEAREVLKNFRKICYGKDKPDKELFDNFFASTKNTKDMVFYSNLLSKAVKSIKGSEDEKAEQTVFDFGGFDNSFANETEDDFELVSFLVLK